MIKLEDAQNRTLTIERNINAPLNLVWEAWTNPDHIAQWWGPRGMATKVVKHNFKVGGRWHYEMTMPDGNKFIGEGQYLEIMESSHVVTSADFKPMTIGVQLHAIFEADGEQTKFTFHCVHETEEYCKQQEAMGFYNGWGSTFDRLEDHVAS